ncbi:MAG: response regulator [Desulfurivibrio sp.]|nr:response regulator [Desulfurivibrio sp.]MBU4034698.1 response regulator [Pseudomonadota bacterium]MBU4117428.1 response regulator [Pseudomonadota bacterium]
MSELPILIVDDEEEFVSTMVQRLRKRGLSSEGVLTGTAAIAKAADSDFSVVLLDMRLPDMDGGLVLQEIKKIRPESRVVILTGHASASEGEEGIRNGAFDYLIKPVEFETLLEKLRTAGNHNS